MRAIAARMAAGSIRRRWSGPADGTALHRDTREAVTIGRVEAMSKSKRNTVDPGAIIERYGADTARWFILSDNPPERDMEWTEAGVAGAHRFTQRLYRLVAGAAPALPRAGYGECCGGDRRRGAAAAASDASLHRCGDGGAGNLRLQLRRRAHP